MDINNTETIQDESEDFIGTINGEDIIIPSYLVMPDYVREALKGEGIETNGCGSTKGQLYVIRMTQAALDINLFVCCAIHDEIYRQNVGKSRLIKVQADSDLHINSFRMLKRSGTRGWICNGVSRFTHALLIIFGDKAWKKKEEVEEK